MRLLDSFAWIEYFIGSKKGVRVKNYIDSEEPLYTPSICLTEIKSRYMRDNKDPTDRLNFIEERSVIVNLDKQIALNASDLKQKYKLHTVDAVVYATGMVKSLVIVTGDQHFEGLPSVDFI